MQPTPSSAEFFLAIYDLFANQTFALYLAFSVSLALVLGYIWYADQFLGKRWKRLSGLSEYDESSNTPMLVPLVSLIAGSVLVAIPVYALSVSVIPPFSIYATYLFWFAFSVGTSIAVHAFERRPWELYLIDKGYDFVVVSCCALLSQLLVVPTVA